MNSIIEAFMKFGKTIVIAGAVVIGLIILMTGVIFGLAIG